MTLGSLIASAVSITAEQADRDAAIMLVTEMSTIEVDALQAQYDDLLREIKLTSNRLEGGMGNAVDNRLRLDSLREARDQALADLSKARQERIQESIKTGTGDRSENPLSSLAQILKIDPETFRLAYSGFIVLLLEIGGLATSAAVVGRPNPTARKKLRYIFVNNVTHILSGDSDKKCLCGSAYKGELMDAMRSPICPECLQAHLERNEA